jgi:DNA polymerase-3 subunit alpha
MEKNASLKPRENSTPMFVHLRVHSAYSLAEGAIPVKKIPLLCQKALMPAVGITDTANLFGALEIATACLDEGIQPITGCEVPLLFDPNLPPASVVVLAQSEQGYLNLLKMVSHLYLREDKKTFLYITLEEFFSWQDGLIVLTGGESGPIGQLYLAGQEDNARKLFLDLFQACGDRFYVELMRHGTSEQAATEGFFCNLAMEHNVPLVATNNVFFSESSMYEAHDALLCIADGAFVEQEKRRRVTPHHYFKTAQEMAQLFEDIPEAITNTVVIACLLYTSPSPRDH